MGGAKRKMLLLTKLLYKFTLKKLFKRHSAASDGANIWVFSQGHPWARQMAHVKWKTVALPRLLGYVPRRLSDFQSWLSSKKKGKSPIPGEKKNAAYFRACLTFSPFKCSRQVLRGPFCRIPLLHGLLCSCCGQRVWGFPKNNCVWVCSGRQAPSATTFCLLEQVPGFQWLEIMPEKQRPSSPEWTVSATPAVSTFLHTTQMSSAILNQLDMANLIIEKAL